VPPSKHQAASDLTTAARQRPLAIPIGDPLPPDRIAEAHDPVDSGVRERVLRSIA
jgi:NADPH2:quinone reductase